MVRKSLRKMMSTMSIGVSGLWRVNRNPITSSAIISIFLMSMLRV